MSKKWLDDYMDEYEKDNKIISKIETKEKEVKSLTKEYHDDYHQRNELDYGEDNLDIDPESLLEMDGTMPEIRYVIRQFKKNNSVSNEQVEKVMEQVLRFINMNMYCVHYTSKGLVYNASTSEIDVSIKLNTDTFKLNYKNQLDPLCEDEKKYVKESCAYYLACKKLVSDNTETIEKKMLGITKYPYSELVVGLLLGFNPDGITIEEIN